MIKKTVVIAIIFFLQIGAIYSQEKFKFTSSIIYKMSHLTDSTDASSRSEEYMELLISDTVSLFRSVKKGRSDSALLDSYKNNIMKLPAPTVISLGKINQSNYQILKYKSGIKVYDEPTGSNLNSLNELYYYYEPIESMQKWDLKDETMTINNFLAQKAEIIFGGRRWIAWFTTEIPIEDGPYKFTGLPGLILRIVDSQNTWSFDFVGIEKNNKQIYINFKEDLIIKEITKKKLYKNRKKYQKNLVNIKSLTGYNLGRKKRELKEKLNNFILHDNNWIELID